MSIETGVVIDRNMEPIHWHTPEDRSAGHLADSPDLWTVLWDRREWILGFAHSHPGSGIPGPSHTDVTTFSAVERGLGRRLWWWITSSDSMVVCLWNGKRGEYAVYPIPPAEEPPWAMLLRARSEQA